MGFHRLDPLFHPGRLLVSPRVLDSALDYRRFLRRHLCGDWGEICEYDKTENRRALQSNEAVISQYNVNLYDSEAAILCIMTEAKRIHTVVFFLSHET
jgi:hypothetical protein